MPPRTNAVTRSPSGCYPPRHALGLLSCIRMWPDTAPGISSFRLSSLPSANPALRRILEYPACLFVVELGARVEPAGWQIAPTKLSQRAGYLNQSVAGAESVSYNSANPSF